MSASKKQKKSNKPRKGGAPPSRGGIHPSWYAVIAVAGTLVAAVVYRTSADLGCAGVAVRVLKLSGVAASGAKVFTDHCAACHGENAAGNDKGPPLVHRIYEPSHHADGTFYRAVRRGVRTHHWPFGDMPPVKEVDNRQIAQILAYVRAVQRANGIE